MDTRENQPIGEDSTKTGLVVDMKMETKVISARTLDELAPMVQNYTNSLPDTECVNVTAAVITVTESNVSLESFECFFE